MKRFILAVLFAGLTAPLGSYQATQEPTDADWDWFGKYRDQVLDQLMPMSSYHDLNYGVAERYFSIRFNHGGVFDSHKLAATIVVPTGSSIQKQLLGLRMTDRSASLDTVLPKIGVRRLTVETPACGALLNQMDRLADVRINLQKRDLIYLPMHRVWHHVVVDFGGDRVDVRLGDPDSALARWATSTMDMLLKCTGKLE
jgi:hypothetical protein